MDSLRKLVLRAPTKSCLLDPVPTNILKDCLDELLPILSTTINLPLESGFFPDIWKESVVTPPLKKQGLDLVFKNFQPISNQIQSYLNEHDLFPPLILEFQVLYLIGLNRTSLTEPAFLYHRRSSME